MAIDKKFSQFDEVTALDSTSEVVLLHGAPQGNKRITKDNFIDSIGVTAATASIASLQAQVTHLESSKVEQSVYDAAIALKADDNAVVHNTIEVISGGGLTGGGDLSTSRTLAVVSANDGITVNSNDIELETIDDLITASTTKPLSANQGKKLKDESEVSANKSNDILTDAASTSKYLTVKATKDYIDLVASGLLDNRGDYDASTNLFPSTGGSGTSGSILKNDVWYISASGSLAGTTVLVGSAIFAKEDTPGQTNSKWARIGSSLTYIAEDLANKSTNITVDSGSAVKYTSVKSVQEYSEALSNKSTNVTTDATSDIKYSTPKSVKTYADTKVSLTGNETVVGIKNFTSSPTVPYSATGSQAVNASWVTAMITGSLPIATSALSPEYAMYTRWLADTGSQCDKSSLKETYLAYLNQLPETVFLFNPHAASKLRTSGVQQYVQTAYDMTTNNYDAVQATEATQPYATTNASPLSKVGVKYVQGQTQTGLLDFTDKVFAADSSWTFQIVLKPNKKVTPVGAVLLFGSNCWISIHASAIRIGTSSVDILNATYSFECGKSYIIEFQYSSVGGVASGLIKVNNIPLTTTPTSAALTFGQISNSPTYPFDGILYHAHLTNTRKSEQQSQLDYTFLRSMYPEIEGVNIGYQHWATSNFEATVDGAGNAIQEIQGATTDGNAELITNGNYEAGLLGALTDTGGGTSTYTLNTTTPIGGVQDGLMDVTSVGSSWSLPRIDLTANSNSVVGKWFQVKFSYKVNSGTCVVSPRFGGANSTSTTISGTGTYTGYILPITNTTAAYIQFAGTNLFNVQINNVSIKEVGWADSTLIYNARIAAGDSVLVATRAAAMWCHYNPDTQTNGILSGSASWTLGTGCTVPITGSAVWDGTQTASSSLSQTQSTLTAAKSFRVQFSLSGSFTGSITPWCGTGKGTARTSAGDYVENITAAGNTTFKLEATEDFNGAVQNIQVRLADGGADLGAIYGKLYNWYAVSQIAANPPKGWRVPSSGDFTQVRTLLGGISLAGAKMKALFGGFNNSYSTNESGLSLLPCGVRSDIGVFSNIAITVRLWSSDSYRLATDNTSAGATIDLYSSTSEKIVGYSLRLLRNEPVGASILPVTTGKFTTNISGSTNKDLTIPFGYKADSVRVVSEATLTNLSCNLYNASSVLQTNLLTGKTVTANVPISFIVVADQPTQFQDPFLRFNAVGNSGSLNIECIANCTKEYNAY